VATDEKPIEIDAGALETARKKVSERYPMPKLHPVIYGAFGALAAWLSLSRGGGEQTYFAPSILRPSRFCSVSIRYCGQVSP